jgi:hypothetical protein
MDERAALHREGNLVESFLQFDGMRRVRELLQRDRKWFPDKRMEENRSSRHTEDLQSLFQPELDEGVKTGDMVNMEMGKKEVDRLLLRDVTVGLGDPVAGIENEVIFACLDKYRNSVAGWGIEPSVGAKERNLHGEGIGILYQKRSRYNGSGVFRAGFRYGQEKPKTCYHFSIQSLLKNAGYWKAVPACKIRSLIDLDRRHENPADLHNDPFQAGSQSRLKKIIQWLIIKKNMNAVVNKLPEFIPV